MDALHPTLLSLAAFAVTPLAVHYYRLHRALQRPAAQAPPAKHSRPDPASIIAALGVVPHPEGGYFIETYRSGSTPMASKGLTALDGELLQTDREDSARNYMTSIIFMATPDAKVLYFGINKSDHVHYYQGGDSYTYIVAHPSGRVEEIVLGGDVLKGQKLQIVFPAGCFKAGYLNEEYCLIGEGVAPGFDFRDFQFVDENELRAVLSKSDNEEMYLSKYLSFVKPDRRRNFDDYYDHK